MTCGSMEYDFCCIYSLKRKLDRKSKSDITRSHFEKECDMVLDVTLADLCDLNSPLRRHFYCYLFWFIFIITNYSNDKYSDL